MATGDLTVRLIDYGPGLGGCQQGFSARLDSKIPTVWPKYQRSPVAFSTRPSRPTSASALWQRGQTGRTSRRQEAVSWCSPFWTVSAKVAAGERPHSAQGFTIRVWSQAHLLSNGEATLR